MHPATMPMEVGVQLMDTIEDEQHATYPFKETIGSLMYAAMAMWPDIMFATSILAQFSQSPTRVHWEVAKWVVRYLKTMHNLELTYTGNDPLLLATLDADMHHKYTSTQFWVMHFSSEVEQWPGA